MAKSPGFWFFTGDWLKDPELRFCSIFARGLLVDLLCYMFEANEIGFLSRPDGTPRSDEQIVDAVNGGDRAQKLAALAELENSGVLSRDSRGVLFSRRLERLGEISKSRSKAGSKGGSKTQAKDKQTAKQNRGVSDSVSVSDSVVNKTNKDVAQSPYLANEEFKLSFEKFCASSRTNHNWIIAESTAEVWLMDLANLPIEEAIAALKFSTGCGSKKPITNGDHKPKPKATDNTQIDEITGRPYKVKGLAW